MFLDRRGSLCLQAAGGMVLLLAAKAELLAALVQPGAMIETATVRLT